MVNGGIGYGKNLLTDLSSALIKDKDARDLSHNIINDAA